MSLSHLYDSPYYLEINDKSWVIFKRSFSIKKEDYLILAEKVKFTQILGKPERILTGEFLNVRDESILNQFINFLNSKENIINEMAAKLLTDLVDEIERIAYTNSNIDFTDIISLPSFNNGKDFLNKMINKRSI